MGQQTPAQAFVVVPFPTLDAAEAWAGTVRAEFPDESPLLVTAGAEDVVLDPRTGETHHELRFEGGWRAKSASIGEGVVVIARTDSELASLSGGIDGHARG